MLNDEFFRETVEDIINNPDNYTKDELYEAFMDMTERYLNEMVTSMNLENALTEDCVNNLSQNARPAIG